MKPGSLKISQEQNRNRNSCFGNFLVCAGRFQFRLFTSLEGVLKLTGRGLEGDSKGTGSCLEGLWKLSGRFLEGV